MCNLNKLLCAYYGLSKTLTLKINLENIIFMVHTSLLKIKCFNSHLSMSIIISSFNKTKKKKM